MVTGTVEPLPLPALDPPPPRRRWRRAARPSAEAPQHPVALTLVPEPDRAGTDRSPLEVEFDGQVCVLLLRIAEEERLAVAAQVEPQHFAWPSWSMDSGLALAQETFVEAWPPQRVVDAARAVRHLVLVLQDWTCTHREDADLDHALTVLATLRSL